MLVNLHTHTKRCRHASGCDEDYVKAAISEGFTALGFSDHAPYIYPNGYVSTYKMTPDETGEYFSSLLDLREKYKGKIDIYIGFETEYYPDLWERTLEFWRGFPLDYLILGQHFTSNEYNATPELRSHASFRQGGNEKITRYVDLAIAAIKTEKITYIAHPDIIRAENYDLDHYRAEMRRLIASAKRADIPLEINLLGVREERHYPSECFFELCGELSPKVVIGFDAHSPEAMTDMSAYKKALEIVRKYSLDLVTDIKPKPVFL